MEKEEAIAIMGHLAGTLEHAPALEDLVGAFAEFLAHIHSRIGEKDFAFLATIGAMIYLRGFRQYNSSLQTDLLLDRLLEASAGVVVGTPKVESL